MEYKILYIISFFLSLIIGSIAVIKIYEIISKIQEPNTKLKKIVLLILSYTYIFHFMYIDNLTFIENVIMTIGILLYILAVENIVIKNKLATGIIQCILAVATYQGTISIFLLTAALFLFIKKDITRKRKNKKSNNCFRCCFCSRNYKCNNGIYC